VIVALYTSNLIFLFASIRKVSSRLEGWVLTLIPLIIDIV
jgi:hypothetical protein